MFNYATIQFLIDWKFNLENEKEKREKNLIAVKATCYLKNGQRRRKYNCIEINIYYIVSLLLCL